MKKQNLDVFNRVYRSTEMYYGWELRQEFMDFAEKINLTDKAVLDIGCGEGRYSLYLAERGCIVTALDASEVGLGKLLRIAQERKLPIVTLQQNLESYTFPDSQYDIIVAATILDHLNDGVRQTAIQGIKRALKTGGIIYANVFTVFDPSYLARVNNLNAAENKDISDTAVCIEHYFEPRELQQQFSDFSILHYYEGMEPDFSHGTPHHHGWASLIAQKPAG